jgi:hypothetical protein
MRAAILGRPALSFAILVCVLGSGALFLWFALGNHFATDFRVYWRTANGPLDTAYASSRLPFPYAPTMLLWVSPLKLISLWPGFLAWVAVSIWAMMRACRNLLSPSETWLVLLNPVAVNALCAGQVSLFLAAGLLWACTTDRRIAAGLALAFIASVKPQLVALAPLFLIARRDWTALASAATGFSVLVAGSLMAFGAQPWIDWLNSLERFHSLLVGSNVLGVAVTPAAAAQSFHLPPLPFLLAGLALGVWLVLACRKAGPLQSSAAIGTGSLLAAPYALGYDLAVILPFLAYATFRGSFGAAFALSGTLNPAPLLLTTWQLFKDQGSTGKPAIADGELALEPGGSPTRKSA